MVHGSVYLLNTIIYLFIFPAPRYMRTLNKKLAGNRLQILLRALDKKLEYHNDFGYVLFLLCCENWKSHPKFFANLPFSLATKMVGVKRSELCLFSLSTLCVP